MNTTAKYHISLNDQGKWQVKDEKDEKSLKLFVTRKEAIAYAKTVAGNQDSDIVIHKVDGKISLIFCFIIILICISICLLKLNSKN